MNHARMNKPVVGWVVSRAADFAILFVVFVGSVLIDGRADEWRDVTHAVLLAGVGFLVVNLGGAFLLTSMAWWFACARLNWAPLVLTAGSVVLLVLTMIAIQLHFRDWSRMELNVLIDPIILISFALHGLSSWIIAARVAR